MPFELISSARAADAPAVAAVAATATATTTPTAFDGFMQFAPLLGILLIMYFLLIRPQQQRMTDHQKMVSGLKRGDKIITGGGVYGTVVKLEGETVLVVEIAENTRIRVQRDSVTALAEVEAPANSNDSAKSRSA